MLTFSGLDANRAVLTFFGAHAAALPDHTREKLSEALAGADWLGGIITALEALYAARADLPAEGVELLDGLARFVSANNFYGKAHRAAQISGVARRIARGGNAEAAGDPKVEPGFEAPAVASEQPAEGDQ
ncbi:hypothetical protein [Erythrobacter sp. WG]|uniref:hypothetical protein n=1 Tax=Erythrobacter sp. WG TaxID=2985510 RepID=UPI00226FD549|nr:hypothetical protein [Erythrobacter sp. WG]MCX9146629.1 hypothetical protein [Erythrobacter sp. WG]